MKKLFIPLFLLAGCGAAGDPPDANSSVSAAKGGAPAAAVQTAGLTGLYEGGSGQTRNQMCILDRGAGDSRFGLVVWGANMHSCSGSGSVTRQGDRLRLSMAGDSTCTLDARIEGGTVTLPASTPAGCSYYCGARASLTNASFRRTGNTAADAMKARDLVGDPLCAGEAG